MTIPVLKVEGLKKYFPITSGIFRTHTGDIKAVDGLDFSIDTGEIVGLVGESGCGKSTAGRASIRLIEPTAGQVIFLGKNLTRLSKQELQEIRPQMQMVFQDPYASLNPRQTIGESIGEALLYHQFVCNRKEQTDQVAVALNQVGLSADVMNRYPHQFSGGQQQRLCIARAIAVRPRLIICDEAVSALDVSVQAQILNLLIELRERLQLSYLFISHDLSIVRYLCNRVLVMHYGRIVESGFAQAVFDSPQHSYTKTLIAAIPHHYPQRRVE